MVRSRQLHGYRNGKKVLTLAGKSASKVIREDCIYEMLPGVEQVKTSEHIRISQKDTRFLVQYADNKNNK